MPKNNPTHPQAAESTGNTLSKLPPNLRRELEEAMAQPDFDPDKLAEALKKARLEAEQAKTAEVTAEQDDRAPWYVIVGRILGFLALSLLFYILTLAMAFAMFSPIYDWMCSMTNFAFDMEFLYNLVISHPTISLCVLIAGYFIFCIAEFKALYDVLMCDMAKH